MQNQEEQPNLNLDDPQVILDIYTTGISMLLRSNARIYDALLSLLALQDKGLAEGIQQSHNKHEYVFPLDEYNI